MFLTNQLAARYIQAPEQPAEARDLLAALPSLMLSGFQDGPPNPDKLPSLAEANTATGGLVDELVQHGLVALVPGGVRITGRGVAELARSFAFNVMPPAGQAGHHASAHEADVLTNTPRARSRLLAGRTVRAWYQRGGSESVPLLRRHQRYASPPARNTVATVVLVDCSHSMILYGEDRFTPAKEMALALAGVIERDFPGDELYIITFHNSATLVPLPVFAMQRIGPWFTNTAAGLHLARSVLRRSSASGKHIVLLTDGKPSMITLPSGSTLR